MGRWKSPATRNFDSKSTFWTSHEGEFKIGMRDKAWGQQVGWAGGVGRRRHIWFCGWPNSLNRLKEADTRQIFIGTSAAWSISDGPTRLQENCCSTSHRPARLPAEVVASKLGPVFSDDLLHALLPGRHHGQPHQHRPQAVFLPDVVGTCPSGEQRLILLAFVDL